MQNNYWAPGMSIEPKDLKASVVPYSPVIGQSVAIVDLNGRVVAHLAVRVSSPSFEYEPTAKTVAEEIVKRFNK